MQPEVNPKMRVILINWLVEVSEEYMLCADTLYQVGGWVWQGLGCRCTCTSGLLGQRQTLYPEAAWLSPYTLCAG